MSYLDSAEGLPEAIIDVTDDIVDFVGTDEFKAVIEELNDVPREHRPDFVESVLLDRAALERRGVSVPEDLLVQRSSFGDGRPTLFCVVKYLPERYHDIWEKVTITFDEQHSWDDFPAEGDAWNRPLHPAELALRLAEPRSG